MNNNDIVSTVVESLHSTEDLEKIETEIGVWINDGGNIQSSLLTPGQVEHLTTTIDKGQRVKLSRPEVIYNLNKMRQQLKQIPILEIVCPFEVEQSFKQQVINYLASNVSGTFVAKFSTNTGLIAGAQVIFKGKFKDYSLIKKLEDDKEKIFGEILRKDLNVGV